MTTAQTYYKATRPNGTDFYTGTILYAVGKTVRPWKRAGVEPKICGAGFLHASDAPGETLIGGRWPCRLFEVTGRPYPGFDANHRHKGGFRQLKVLRELPAHLALGPNGKLVAGIIERSGRLTYDEAIALRYAARDAARGARGAAWGAARDAAWGAARDAAWGAARGAARDAAWGAAWGAARDAAWGAAWASLALLVRDLITPEQFDLFYGPWAKVIDSKDKPRKTTRKAA